jgi:hypothetical protein
MGSALSAARASHAGIRGAWVALVAVSMLAALALLQADWIPWSARGAYSDLAVTHWPNAVFIQNTLRETGRLPLWRPLIMAGAPFAANPLSGLWYPPNLLLLVLPLPAAFNLLLALHLAWGGWGMYRLARQVRLAPAAALVSAVVWIMTPKAVAHLAAGHVGLVYALAWWPWVVWAARRLRQSSTWPMAAMAAGALALQFLADPRIAALTLPVAAVAFLFTTETGTFGARRPRKDATASRRPAREGAKVVHVAFALLLFLLLTAAQTLPLAEFMRYASRAALTAAESAELSLPWRYLLGMVLPDRGGFHEWMTYAGPAVLVLAALGLRRLGRRGWLVVGGLAFATLFALGENAPVYALLTRVIPELTWLRVPARAWFVVAFGLALLAGYGVAALGRGLRPGGRLTPRGAATAALALVVLDLGIMDASLVRLQPVAAALAEGGDLAAMLAEQPGLFRLYSPSYSLPQQTGAVYGLQTVDGVDPLQLAETVAFVREASGVGDALPGYSVVLPPLPPGSDVATAHRDRRPDVDLLSLLNVRYVMAAFPLQVEGLVEKGRFSATYLYENTRALPRAFVVSRAETVGGPAEALARLKVADAREVAFIEGGIPLVADNRSGPVEASVLRYTPDHITIQANLDRSGVLVLSEVWYPGWIARVDGQVTPIYRADGLLRAVYLEAGSHTVDFSYEPWTVRAGLALSALGCAALVAAGVRTWRLRGRHR